MVNGSLFGGLFADSSAICDWPGSRLRSLPVAHLRITDFLASSAVKWCFGAVMDKKRHASPRDVGTALLAALNDRDHRLLVIFRCDDVVIEVASQVLVFDPAEASQAILMGLLEGPWKQWTLVPGSVHVDGTVALMGFSAEGSSTAGIYRTREGVLGVLVVESSLRAMSFSIDDVVPRAALKQSS